MKRREFLRGAAAGMLGGLGLTLGACATSAPEPSEAEPTEEGASPPAQGQEAVEWRMGTSWPVSLDTIYGGATTVAERVSQMTDGMFKIETFPAGELFGGTEVLQNVQQGAVEAGHTASYYYVGLNSALAFGTSVPFGLTAQQQNAWLYHGGGMEAMHKVYADFNAIGFPAGNTGTQMGGWFRNEINSTSDLQGLKMRIPGLGGRVMERLGVNVQVLAAPEIYQALQTGAIDATEWVGPYDDQKLGFFEVADYYYTPGWWEPGPTLDVQVNLEAWNKLSPAYQEILKTACYEANINMLAKYDALNRQALDELLGNGVQLRTYSDEILSAAQTAAFELYAEESASNPSFQEIFGPWKEFRDRVYKWHQTNELPMTTFVYNNPV